MHILEGLNPLQQEAATVEGGPVLVIAGAGSGKTRVLTMRIAHLVKNLSVPPERILAVTFTNKAAEEMRKRLAHYIGRDSERVWLGTFHSVGLRILKKEGYLLGIPPEPVIYDNDDQLKLIKECMEELNVSERVFPPKRILYMINHAKNENILADQYPTEGNPVKEVFGRVYRLYQERLAHMHALDFGDLICQPIRLFKKHPHVLRAYQDRFMHILIDEYQDTNRAQHILVNLLAAQWQNLFAVGDPDQSIYTWRGADIRNILEFEKDWSGATIIRLEQNYRSTQRILAAANEVIKNNRQRYEKNLWTENNEGTPPIFCECEDEHHEAKSILDCIERMKEEDPELSYRDIAVFYRTNAQSRVFEEWCMRRNIPYRIVGGVKFYERREIKDAIAYLRLVANPRDSLSLKRIVNVPSRGIGVVTLKEMEKRAKEEGIPLYDAFLKAAKDGTLKKPEQREFFQLIEEIRKNLDNSSPQDVALRLLEETGYMRMLEEEGTEEAFDRLENLHEFISAIADTKTASLTEFLETISLVSDVDTYNPDEDSLTLMTIHSAKGLEFDVVFIAGLEEGLFPHANSLHDEDRLEEERRLCYVAMTRARKRLFLFCASQRRHFGESRYSSPSRFVNEIPPHLLEIQGANEQIEESEEPASFSKEPWQIGMKVVHPSFGVGIIRAKEGIGEDAKLTVRFKNGEAKKLVVKYANLIPVQI